MARRLKQFDRWRAELTPGVPTSPGPIPFAAPTRSRNLLAAAVCILVLPAIGATGYAGYRLGKSGYNALLEQMLELKPQIRQLTVNYEQLRKALPIEDSLTLTVEAFAPEKNAIKDQIRITLSPELPEDRLISVVYVYWGDGKEETLYDISYEEAAALQWLHRYSLPATGDGDPYELRVEFDPTDAVSLAMLQRPEKLTQRYAILPVATGLQVAELGTSDIPGARRPTANGWGAVDVLSPKRGSAVGWKATLTVMPHANTKRGTALVRPQGSGEWYVQPGAGPLAAGHAADFPIQLGASRSIAVDKPFDLMLICEDQFRPTRSVLTLADIPTSRVTAMTSVIKVAGMFDDTATTTTTGRSVTVSGMIFTQDGGALLLTDPRGVCHVTAVLEARLLGGPFEEPVPMPDPGQYAIHLAVRQMGAMPLDVGQVLKRLPAADYWIYGPIVVHVERESTSEEFGGDP